MLQMYKNYKITKGHYQRIPKSTKMRQIQNMEIGQEFDFSAKLGI